LGLNYRIVYKKGTNNKVVDALSRSLVGDLKDSSSACMTLSTIQPRWIQEVAATYSKDEQTKEIISKISIDLEVVPNFTWVAGLLRYKSRIWVGNDLNLG
jgi:hypothetical protein